jgi:hypothetical protein
MLDMTNYLSNKRNQNSLLIDNQENVHLILTIIRGLVD